MTNMKLSAAALAALLATAPAWAQTEGTTEATPVPPAEGTTDQDVAATFDDATLEAFVTAALDVREIRTDYETRIAEAGDQAAAEELATEAREEMLQAVEASGDITVEEYMAVGTAAQSDAALAERLTALFQEQGGDDVTGG